MNMLQLGRKSLQNLYYLQHLQHLQQLHNCKTCKTCNICKISNICKICNNFTIRISCKRFTLHCKSVANTLLTRCKRIANALPTHCKFSFICNAFKCVNNAFAMHLQRICNTFATLQMAGIYARYPKQGSQPKLATPPRGLLMNDANALSLAVDLRSIRSILTFHSPCSDVFTTGIARSRF